MTAPKPPKERRLTADERALLDMVASGMSNAEIAKVVHRSRVAVSLRVQGLYALFGIASGSRQQRCGSRVRLAMMAVSLGLVSAREAARGSTIAVPATQASASPARAVR